MKTITLTFYTLALSLLLTASANAQFVGLQYSHVSPLGDFADQHSPGYALSLMFKKAEDIDETLQTLVYLSYMSLDGKGAISHDPWTGEVTSGVPNLTAYELGYGLEARFFPSHFTPYAGLDIFMSYLKYDNAEYIDGFAISGGVRPKLGAAYNIEGLMFTFDVGYDFAAATSGPASYSLLRPTLSVLYYLY